MSSMDKIFISIPSYEDELLLETINDILNKAAYPDRLRFGIALQYKQLPTPDLSFLGDRATILNYDVDNRPGIIKIRGEIGKLIKDETYFLGIDAHTLFRKNWDEILIRDHKFLQEATGNPLICIGEIYDGHIPNLGYEGNQVNMYLNTNFKLKPVEKYPKFPYVDNHADIWEKVITNATKPTDIMYKSIYFVSQNFWFTTTDFWHDGLFPGYHELAGEEMEVSISLHVNGYDMFKPINRHIVNVPASESTNRSNPIHWRSPGEKNWVIDDREMLEEVLKLFILGENKYYSFNNRARSVESFWRAVGLGDVFLTIKSGMLSVQ